MACARLNRTRQFVAHGPWATRARRRLAEAGGAGAGGDDVRLAGFRNVELYGLVARLLGLDPLRLAPTNGTAGFWDAYF